MSLKRFILSKLFFKNLGIAIVIVIAVIMSYKEGKFELLPTCFIAGLLGLISICAFSRFLKSFSSENWLVFADCNGLYIKFRSHLNKHFPKEDCQVVQLDYNEIESARITLLVMKYFETKQNSRVVISKYENYLDIEVAPEMLNELNVLLNREYSLKVKSKVHSFPVSMPNVQTIRISWKSIKPAVCDMTSLLQRQNVEIKETVSETSDYTSLEGLGNDKINEKLKELMINGEIFAAKKVARIVYNYNETEARKFIDQLFD